MEILSLVISHTSTEGHFPKIDFQMYTERARFAETSRAESSCQYKKLKFALA